MTDTSLRLKPFEEYFLLNHRVDNPSTFLMKLTFHGRLDRSLADATLEHLIRLHPLTGCRIQVTGNHSRWVPADPRPKIDWRENPVSAEEIHDTNLEITAGPPMEILAHDGRNGPATMLVLIHHCAFDGLGAIQWLSDFLEVYRCLQANETPTIATDASLLSRRCQPSLSWSRILRLLPGQWKSVRETFRVLSRQAIPLVPFQPDRESRSRRPSFLQVEFDHDQTAALKRFASTSSSSLNSIAACDLLTAIKAWQDECNVEAQGTHFRIMIPVNERDRSMKRLPACNHCTIINLDFPRDAIEHRDRVLADIDQRMSVIRRWRLSLNFWRVLSLFRWLPGGLARPAQSENISATALLTNVGRVFQKFTVTQRHMDNQIGPRPLSLLDFNAWAPVARGTAVAFGIYYFNNRLRISLQYDGRQLDAEHAGQLMERFRQQLLDHIGC